MFNSVVAMSCASKVYPELEGKRVLIAGLKPGVKTGSDIVRAFAAQGCRIVLQFDQPQGLGSNELYALAEEVTGQTLGLRVFAGTLENDIAVARMTSAAVKAFGNLDAVVTVSHLADDIGELSSEEDFDAAVAATLRRAYLISRIAANRMRLSSIDGAVLNVLAPPAGASRQTNMLFALAKSELDAMTRVEAETWKHAGIRFVALAPDVVTDADGRFAAAEDKGNAAAILLFLASEAGARMSGLTFSTSAAACAAAAGAETRDPATVRAGASAVSLAPVACAEPEL